MTIAIRPATGGDVAAIDALLRAAFAAEDEALLVQRLCMAGDMVLTLVADDEDSGMLAGTVVFSRMRAEVGGQPIAAVALAPVAVAPAHRRQGVAEALVQSGVRMLAGAGIHLCFVLGDPAYYERFGFSADWAQGFDSPYAGPNLLALPLQGGAMPCGVRGPAVHADAFALLGAA